ncbi:unknown [Anaerotruncus sp. CAG:390]|nr:unknown [Anaerotruncus sp. CAG:390]
MGLSFLIMCIEYIIAANTTAKTLQTAIATLYHGM